MKDFTPKAFVFVLMPFTDDFDDIYELGIKQACKDVGAYCERVDEQLFEGSILTRIFNQISKADIIISDLTGKNPNVFYETGYAHALGKKVILLTQKVDDIPFDLKHHPHLIYNGKIKELKEKLTSRVQWFIENPQEEVRNIESNLEYYITGQNLNSYPNFKVQLCNSDRHGTRLIHLKLDIHNPNNHYFRKTCDIGFVTPTHFSYYSSDYRTSKIELPEGKLLFMFHDIGHLLPGSWESRDIFIRPSSNDFMIEQELVLRVFSDLGVTDYPFTILIDSEL